MSMPIDWRLNAFDHEILYIHNPVDRVNDIFEIGFEMDEIQKNIVRSKSKRVLMMCTRQYGKTTIVAIKAATEALASPGLILVIAPVERQARECFRKIKAFLKKAIPGERWPEDNKTSLELQNGARIVALPAKGGNIRGYTNPRIIIIDEAAFVGDDDYRSIRPMLSHGARLIVMSTPFGKDGWFYETVERIKKGEEEWEYYSVTANECSHISGEFLNEEKAALGPWWYKQEYECEFLDSVTSFFNMEAVYASLEDGIDPLLPIRHGTEFDFQGDESVLPLELGAIA